jgi:hypothetical protein
MLDERETWIDRITNAVSEAVSRVYDRVAVNKESVLRDVEHYELGITTWEEYQRKAPLKVMEEIADGHVQWTKIKVSGLGTALGAGGLALIIPDTLQFLTLTIRMVTGIAAAYGFDPHPEYLGGKVKVIVLQAYLNANLGKSAVAGAEKVGLGAAVKFLRDVAMRSNFLIKLIVAIGKVIGVRVTRQMLLKALPGVAAGINGALGWFLTRGIANHAKAEFRQFREDLRRGKYKDDPDYEGLGREPSE